MLTFNTRMSQHPDFHCALPATVTGLPVVVLGAASWQPAVSSQDLASSSSLGQSSTPSHLCTLPANIEWLSHRFYHVALLHTDSVIGAWAGYLSVRSATSRLWQRMRNLGKNFIVMQVFQFDSMQVLAKQFVITSTLPATTLHQSFTGFLNLKSVTLSVRIASLTTSTIWSVSELAREKISIVTSVSLGLGPGLYKICLAIVFIVEKSNIECVGDWTYLMTVKSYQKIAAHKWMKNR